MGQTYSNAIQTSAGFKFNAEAPLDDRVVVDTFADLSDLKDDNKTYNGMTVSVTATKGLYYFDKVQNNWIRLAKTKTENGHTYLDEELEPGSIETTDLADNSITSSKIKSSQILNRHFGEVISIEKGGTGENNKYDAVRNLGAVHFSTIAGIEADGPTYDPLREDYRYDSSNIIFSWDNTSESTSEITPQSEKGPNTRGIVFSIYEDNHNPSLDMASQIHQILITMDGKIYKRKYADDWDLEPETFTKVQIVETDIATDAVTTSKIKDSNVTENKIAIDAVTTSKIKDSNVTTDKINNSAVTENKIAIDAVTTSKIKDSNVTTDKINNSAVTENKIATDAVTTSKIKNNAVTTDKINNSAVTENKIATDAVTTSKIKNNAVTKQKLSLDLQNVIIGTSGTGIMRVGDSLAAGTIYIQYD